MHNNKKNKIKLFIVIVFTFIALILYLEVDAYRDNKLYLNFLDVGQGDAIYIRTPDRQDIVVDGGPDNSVLAQVGKLMPFYDRKIELMVLTHPHEDHVDGLIELLKSYQVEKILMPDAEYKSAANDTWLQEIENNNIPVYYAYRGQQVDLGAVKLTVLNPEKDKNKFENINNASVVLYLEYGNNKALLMGDAEAEVEAEIIKLYKDNIYADIVKAGHHGSNTSNTEKFIQAVQPEYAVISVGVNNKYNHPSDKTIANYNKNKAEVLRTDLLGTISCISDSIKFSCSSKKF